MSKRIIGFRVVSSGFYVQAQWGNEDKTRIINAWSERSKGPLFTKAEAYQIAAYWLKCGYEARIVRVMKKDPTSLVCQCHHYRMYP